MTPKAVWPVGAMESITVPYAAAITLAPANQLSEQTLSGVVGNASLAANTDTEVKAGAIMMLIIPSDASIRTFTPDGVTIKGPAIATVASKTHTVMYVYGSDKVWKQFGTVVQIN